MIAFIKNNRWVQGILIPIGIIVFFLLIALFIQWLNTPLDVIYDPDGPLYWWYDDGYH